MIKPYIDKYVDKIKEFFGDEEKKIYLIGVVTLITGVLYVSFIILPKMSELARTSREVSDLKDQINVVTSRVKKMEETSGKLESLRNEQKTYAKQLPPEKEVPSLLEGLSSIAEKAGVDIKSITPYAIIEPDPKFAQDVYYREMPLLLTAKSGYHQLGMFISDLEEAQRFITIEDVRIRYDDKAPRMHNVRMLLKTYVAVGGASKPEKAKEEDVKKKK